MGQMQRNWRRTREHWGEVRPKVTSVEYRRWKAHAGETVRRLEDWAALGVTGDHDFLLKNDPPKEALDALAARRPESFSTNRGNHDPIEYTPPRLSDWRVTREIEDKMRRMDRLPAEFNRAIFDDVESLYEP